MIQRQVLAEDVSMERFEKFEEEIEKKNINLGKRKRESVILNGYKNRVRQQTRRSNVHWF